MSSGKGLPFAAFLDAAKIERVFAKHGGLFGLIGIYTTAVMVWSFLAQVLRDGKEASCQAAVARVVSFCEQQGLEAPTDDTGDYCRARTKLSEGALHELSCEVAGELELAADARWLWKGNTRQTHRRLHLHDARYAGEPSRVPAAASTSAWSGAAHRASRGRALVATGSALNAAYGPYRGKETGESALLRSMLASLKADDIAVTDRYYCSFMMIALKDYLRRMLRQIAHCEVANRPGRLEPRVLKRRRHGYKLRQKPRAVLRDELQRRCT